MQHNPFGESLDESIFQSQIELLSAEILARIDVLRERDIENNRIIQVQENDDNADETESDLVHKIELEDFVRSSTVKDDEEINALQVKLDFNTNALKFVNMMTSAQVLVERMIASKTMTDIIEALHFFSCALNFNLKGSGVYQRK
jgi:hypothetical protein